MKLKRPGKKEVQDRVLPTDFISKAKSSIKAIQEKRGSKILAFIGTRSIDRDVAFELNKILRKMQHTKKLDVILDSGGGDIDSAYKILNMFREYADSVTVIVPFYAKSAASLIALGADELIVCASGELGPLDPQVMDPQTGLYVPAHSIKETMDFIEETREPVVRLSLADKIPIFLIGAYRAAGKLSKQYLEEIFTKKNYANKDKTIEIFTEHFLSHGYPMHRKFLIEKSIPLAECPKELEDKICDLHEHYMDFYKKKWKGGKDIFIIQTDAESVVVSDSEM